MGASRGGPTPPLREAPPPSLPGAPPPRPLRPGQVAGVRRGWHGVFLEKPRGWLAGWRAGGLAAARQGGGYATAGVRPREREAQWVGRSRLRVRELIPPAALFRGPLSVLSLRLSPPWGVRPSVRLSVCPSLERLLLGEAPLPLLSPRSVRGCGGSTGWVLWH